MPWRSWRCRALLVYLLLLHAGLGYWGVNVVWRPWATDLAWRPMLLAEMRAGRVQLLASRALASQGSVVFLGDSMVEAMAVTQVLPCTENFGIGGETVDGVAGLVPRLALGQAPAVLLHVGINDWAANGFAGFGARYAALLAQIPAAVPVFASAMLPVDPARARLLGGALPAMGAANAAMQAACTARPGCVFVTAGAGLAGPDGALAPAFSLGDGVHLNAPGYRVFGQALRGAMLAHAPALAGHRCAGNW